MYICNVIIKELLTKTKGDIKMEAAVKVYRLSAFYSSDTYEFVSLCEDLDYIIVDKHEAGLAVTVVVDADKVDEFKSLVDEVFAYSKSLTEIH